MALSGSLHKKGGSTREHFTYVQPKPCEYSICTLGIHSQVAIYHNMQSDSFLDKLYYLYYHLWSYDYSSTLDIMKIFGKKSSAQDHPFIAFHTVYILVYITFTNFSGFCNLY